MKARRMFKRALILCLTVLIPLVLQASFVLAGCDNPGEKTYTTTACYGDKISISFTKDVIYFSPAPPCAAGTVKVTSGDAVTVYRYVWDQDTCTAAISVDCDYPPIYWVYFEGNKMFILNAPILLSE